MIEPKNIAIDGLEFNLQPLPALKALKLDKRVISLLIPALGGLKGLNLDQEVDMSEISRGLSASLGDMKDEEFEAFACNLLSSTLYKPAGKPPEQITPDIINMIFQGRIIAMYKLMFEVMRFNQFSPFALLGGGNIIQKILSSPKQKEKINKPGQKSEMSGSLLEN